MSLRLVSRRSLLTSADLGHCFLLPILDCEIRVDLDRSLDIGDLARSSILSGVLVFSVVAEGIT